MSVTKADIADRILKDKLASARTEAAEYVDVIFAIMKETLGAGEDLKLTRFGNFMIVNKRARNGRDPQTGEEIVITARRIVTFKASLALRAEMNEK